METILAVLESQPGKAIAVTTMVIALVVITYAMRRHWRRNLLPYVVLAPGVPLEDRADATA
jgi:type IV secretory pathway TrbF-like protein